MSQPGQLDSPPCQLPRNDGSAGCNAHKPRDAEVGLGNGDCRGSELHGLDRHEAQRQGASQDPAQISAAGVPVEPSAGQILMPVNFGTPLRYRRR